MPDASRLPPEYYEGAMNGKEKNNSVYQAAMSGW